VRLVFEDQGWEDYTSWLKTDRKMLARINKLIEDIRRDPCTGIGKPEPLTYHLPGAWSRRIDDEPNSAFSASSMRAASVIPERTLRALPRSCATTLVLRRMRFMPSFCYSRPPGSLPAALRSRS